MQVLFTVKLPVQIKKKGSMFISSCPILDICSQGETEKRAQENIIEAVRLFLSSCFERGTLDQVLKDCGFTPMPDGSKRGPTKSKAQKAMKEVTVPWPFIVPAHRPHSAPCHA